MSKYTIGSYIETKYFYVGSHGTNIYKRGLILEKDDSHYKIDFEDGCPPRRIGIKTCDRLSKKFDPGSGVSRKLKFLT